MLKFLMQKNTATENNERPIRTALVVRPVMKEDFRYDLTEFRVREGSGGHEILMADSTAISGTNLPVYGPRALDSDALCPDLIEDLIVRAMHGETGAVMAMGQTGSGKSHLMGTECCKRRASPSKVEGEDKLWQNSVGQYVPRRIFELGALQHSDSFEVQCAMVEVYSQKQHDSVRDLLAHGRPQIDKPAAPLKFLQWFPAADAAELQSKLLEGSDARETSRTVGNNRSSRSHAIFMIKIALTQKLSGGAMQKVTAQLMLVDLAGSEQAAAAASGSTTFKEGAGINLGLLSLGGVIEDLARGNPPQYNDCALTRILRPALGGNANAVMIGCISPLVAHLDYTKRTLSYIAKAGTIKNNVKADVTALKRDKEERLQAEVVKLRAKLEELQLQESSAKSADTVILSRLEYQRLVGLADAERLRADRLDVMLRHATAQLRSPGPPSAAHLPPCSTDVPERVAPSEWQGRVSPVENTANLGCTPAHMDIMCLDGTQPSMDAEGGVRRSIMPQSDTAMPAVQQVSNDRPGTPAPGQVVLQAQRPTRGKDPPAQLASSAAPLPAQVELFEEDLSIGSSLDDSCLLSDGSVADNIISEVCLEKETHLQPQQLDLLKTHLGQEQRGMRQQRAQQALGVLQSCREQRGAPLAHPPVAPASAEDVCAWARRAVEERARLAEWHYVLDSLQHEVSYLRTRHNTSTRDAVGPAGAAEDCLRLQAQMEAAQEKLLQARQEAASAECLWKESAWRDMSWLRDCTSQSLVEVVVGLVGELMESRLQTCSAQQLLFQQRLLSSSLELALLTYNSCLGDAEHELYDAAAEVQVLRGEKEEFQQAIEEKMRYVQLAAAAQNALDVLHAQIDQLEKQLLAAREAGHAAQGQHQTSPGQSLSATLRSWATLGRSPTSHQEGHSHSPSSLSRHSSLPGSMPGSLPGSPRHSIGGRGGGGFGDRAASTSHPSPPPGSPPSFASHQGLPPGTSPSLGSTSEHGTPPRARFLAASAQQSPLGKGNEGAWR